jgi:hypothetical protein
MIQHKSSQILLERLQIEYNNRPIRDTDSKKVIQF